MGRAKKLAALPDAKAQDTWLRTMLDFDQTDRACAVPLDRVWPGTLAFARVELDITKLFVLSVRQTAIDRGHTRRRC